MKHFIFFTLFFVVIFSCTPSKKVSKTDADSISFTILQTNDVYEIAPLEGGKAGGMARVGQLKNDLLKENPNTISVMAGDFLNPSVIGTLKYEGKRIKGKQMIEAMNASGIDLVTFGNHEFDLKEKELLERIEESEFDWTVANVFHVRGDVEVPFKHRGKDIPKYHIETFKNASGQSIKVAFLSVCLDVNKPKYISFSDPLATAKDFYKKAQEEADIVIGLTHQDLENDLKLAKELPNLPLIIGGHEHTNMNHKVGNVTVAKADANAKSAYIHRLEYNKKTGKVKLNSTLRKISNDIPLDPKTNAVVQKWMKIAQIALKEDGIDADKAIITLKEPIDATESTVRYVPSVISTLVVNAIANASPTAQGALMNTGSIRIDDYLSGKITQFDIVRLLPYGGELVEVDMKGALLLKILDIGLTVNVGKGGYLALNNLSYNTTTQSGTIGGQPIAKDKTYKIAMPSFLMTGGELNLDFLTTDNPDVINVTKPTEGLKMDIRYAVIDYMENNPIPVLKK